MDTRIMDTRITDFRTRTALDVDPVGPTRPRTLHLIDIENQIVESGRRVTARDAADWWSLYREQAVGVGPRDLVFVGVSVSSTRVIRPAFAQQKVAWRIGHAGPDGADLALLASVYAPHAAKRFERIVIASGDHIFASLAREARAHGLQVQVVASRDKLSAELADAATTRSTIRRASRAQEKRTLDAIRGIRAACLAA